MTQEVLRGYVKHAEANDSQIRYAKFLAGVCICNGQNMLQIQDTVRAAPCDCPALLPYRPLLFGLTCPPPPPSPSGGQVLATCISAALWGP